MATHETANSADRTLDELRDDAAHLVGDVADMAKEKVREGAERGQEMADDAGKLMEEARTVLERQIRENPLLAVGAAVGLGVVLAALTRK